MVAELMGPEEIPLDVQHESLGDSLSDRLPFLVQKCDKIFASRQTAPF